MKPEIKTITPEVAKKMLAANTNNRPISLSQLRALVREMMLGKWRINGDMIRVGESGKILDGQHRLHAVIKSNTTIGSWVMYGVPDNTFNTIDTGKRRSPSDTLSCDGEKSSIKLAAALMLVDRYVTGRINKAVSYSNSDVQELLKKYPDIRESIIFVRNSSALLAPSILHACYYLFCRKDQKLANEFITKVFKGIGLQEGDPFYALREKLLSNSISTSKLQKESLIAYCITAWNHARKKTTVNILRVNHIEGKLLAMPIIQ